MSSFDSRLKQQQQIQSAFLFNGYSQEEQNAAEASFNDIYSFNVFNSMAKDNYGSYFKTPPIDELAGNIEFNRNNILQNMVKKGILTKEDGAFGRNMIPEQYTPAIYEQLAQSAKNKGYKDILDDSEISSIYEKYNKQLNRQAEAYSQLAPPITNFFAQAAGSVVAFGQDPFAVPIGVGTVVATPVSLASASSLTLGTVAKVAATDIAVSYAIEAGGGSAAWAVDLNGRKNIRNKMNEEYTYGDYMIDVSADALIGGGLSFVAGGAELGLGKLFSKTRVKEPGTDIDNVQPTGTDQPSNGAPRSGAPSPSDAIVDTNPMAFINGMETNVHNIKRAALENKMEVPQGLDRIEQDIQFNYEFTQETGNLYNHIDKSYFDAKNDVSIVDELIGEKFIPYRRDVVDFKSDVTPEQFDQYYKFEDGSSFDVAPKTKSFDRDMVIYNANPRNADYSVGISPPTAYSNMGLVTLENKAGDNIGHITFETVDIVRDDTGQLHIGYAVDDFEGKFKPEGKAIFVDMIENKSESDINFAGTSRHMLYRLLNYARENGMKVISSNNLLGPGRAQQERLFESLGLTVKYSPAAEELRSQVGSKRKSYFHESMPYAELLSLPSHYWLMDGAFGYAIKRVRPAAATRLIDRITKKLTDAKMFEAFPTVSMTQFFTNVNNDYTHLSSLASVHDELANQSYVRNDFDNAVLDAETKFDDISSAEIVTNPPAVKEGEEPELPSEIYDTDANGNLVKRPASEVFGPLLEERSRLQAYLDCLGE